jgi:hypothetical protein
MIYNLSFFLYEIPEIIILRLGYINDTWNIIDIVKIVYSFLYLLGKI